MVCFTSPQGPEACDRSTWKAEARGLGIQSQPQLLKEFEASLGYMRFYKTKTSKPTLPSCLVSLINQVLTSPKEYEFIFQVTKDAQESTSIPTTLACHKRAVLFEPGQS